MSLQNGLCFVSYFTLEYIDDKQAPCFRNASEIEVIVRDDLTRAVEAAPTRFPFSGAAVERKLLFRCIRLAAATASGHCICSETAHAQSG